MEKGCHKYESGAINFLYLPQSKIAPIEFNVMGIPLTHVKFLWAVFPKVHLICHQNMASNSAKHLFAALGNALEPTGISEQGTQRASWGYLFQI